MEARVSLEPDGGWATAVTSRPRPRPQFFFVDERHFLGERTGEGTRGGGGGGQGECGVSIPRSLARYEWNAGW